MNHRTKIRLIALALAAFFVLAACTGNSPTPSTGTGGSSGSGGSSGDPVASTGPKYGGILQTMFCCDAIHFDPHKGTGAQNFVPLTYSTLVRYKTGPDVPVNAFELEPDLAERWEQPDDTTYIFYLRKGVKFHNKPPVNGRELTADDVVFSIERMLSDDPENIQRSLFEVIETVEALDDYTVKLTLSEPFAPLLANLGTVFASILPRADIDFKQEAIGTGPFMLDSFEKGVKYTYAKHPEYFEEGQPYLDGFVIHVNPDLAPRLAAFRGRQIDLIDLVEYMQAKPVADADSSITIEKWPGNFSVMVRMNTRKPPLDDVRVRQALSLAADRPAIAKALGGGEGVVNGPIPSVLSDWTTPHEELFGFTRDVERAKQLLAEAGYPDGFSIKAVGGSISNRKIMLEALSSQWAEIGVDLEIELVPTAEVNRLRVEQDWHMLADNFTLAADPDSYLYGPYFSTSNGNLGGYNDPVLDELLLAQRLETDPVKRKELVKQAEQRAAEQVFILTSGDAMYSTLTHPYVKGYRHSYINQYLPIRNVWLDK